MKTRILFLLLFFTTATFCIDAQINVNKILKRTKEKTNEKVEKRIEKKLDQAVDKKLDQAEEQVKTETTKKEKE
jgi:hypothetical protein